MGGISELKFNTAPTPTAKSTATGQNNGGFGGGLEYLGRNLGAGVVGVGEGIYDYIVGGAAQAFGNEEYAKRLHDNDISGKMQQEAFEKFNPNGAWEFAGQVASGLGQSSVGMLAAAGITLLTGGAGAGVAAGAMIGAGAAGKATTEAYNKTGTLGGKEYLYGAASGLLEGGLESLTGVAGKAGKALGKGAASSAAKTLTRKSIAKGIFTDACGEFVEESISEAAQPYLLRGLDIDKDAENATLQEIMYAGAVGFVSGAIMSGATGASYSAKNYLRGSKAVSSGKVSEILAEANAIGKYMNESETAKLVAPAFRDMTASLNAYNAESDKTGRMAKLYVGEIQAGLSRIHATAAVKQSLDHIQNSAEDVAKWCAENGQVVSVEDIRTNKDGVAMRIAVADVALKMVLPNHTVKTLNDTIKKADKEMRKGALSAETNSEIVAAQRQIERLQKESKGGTMTEGEYTFSADHVLTAEEFTKMKNTSDFIRSVGVLATSYDNNTDRELQNAAIFNAVSTGKTTVAEVKAINKFAKRVGLKVRFESVESKGGSVVKGYFKDGTVTINVRGAHSFSAVVVHEYLHHIALKNKAKFVEVKTAVVELCKNNKDMQKAYDDAIALYKKDSPGKTEDFYAEEAVCIVCENLVGKFGKGEAGKVDFAKVEKTHIRTLRDFFVAIKERVKEYAVKDTNDALTKTVNVLNNALMANAVKKDVAYNGNKSNNAVGKTVDSQIETQYNNEERFSKRTVDYIPYKKIGNENVEYVRRELRKLYNGFDNCIANGIAIIREKTIYILDTAKYDGKERFGFRETVTISDNEKRAKYAQKINEESANDGFGNREIYEKLGVKLGNDSDGNVRRELQQDTQDTPRESSNLKNRPFEIDRNKRVQEIKFSFKDSEGNALSEQQAEYFKDSKVRDKDGNLLVVYHGTPNGGFTIFNTEYDGAYFTANKEYAKAYTRTAELGDNAQIYKSYLNITKPFDTRTPADKKLFMDKFFMRYGNGTPLSEQGLPDWTDGSDLFDFLKEYDYDGMLIDEGGTPTESGGVSYRGISYVVFDSNQAKLTTNKNPTKNKDIRYSIAVTQEDVNALRTIGRKNITEFTQSEIDKTQNWAKKYQEELGTKSPFFRAWFGDWREYDLKNRITPIAISHTISINTNNRFVKNVELGKIHITENVFSDSLHYADKDKVYIQRLLSRIDEIIESAILLDTSTSENNKKNKKSSTQFMHYLYNVVEYNGNPFLAKIAVEEYGNETNRRAYNVQRIKMSALSRTDYDLMKRSIADDHASSVDSLTVSQLFTLVKQYDSKFNPRPVSPHVLTADEYAKMKETANYVNSRGLLATSYNNNTDRDMQNAAIFNAVSTGRTTVAEVTAINKFAKRVGLKVRFESVENKGGSVVKGFFKDGTVTVNVRGSHSFSAVVVHEYLHHLALKNNAKFAEVKTAIAELCKSNNDMQKAYDDAIALYKKDSPGKTEDFYAEEAVCIVCEKLISKFGEGETGKVDFSKIEKTHIRSLRDFFVAIKERIKDYKVKASNDALTKTISVLNSALMANAVKKDVAYNGNKSKSAVGKTVDSIHETPYNKEERFSRRFWFLHKNFPTEKESGSEANRLAIWWASNKNVETGERTLISMNGRWYLVEKFDDADNNYQVEAFITKAEYNEIFKEIKENGRSGKIKSIQTSTNVIDKLNQSKYSLKGRESSSISDGTKYGTENNSIQRVGEEQIDRRERTTSNGTGNSEGGGQDKQRDSIKFSIKDLVNSTMSMETCRDMIKRTYNYVNPNQYEEAPIWHNGEEWLKDVGVREVALCIDSEVDIASKYFSEKKTPAVYNGDVTTEEILEAYLEGTLTGSAVIAEKPNRLKISESNGYIDNRFYSPQKIEEIKAKYEIATQKITNENRDEVNKARADVLVFSHTKNACELIGISQTELNKKLLSWAHYPARARDASIKINKDVAFENKWTGLENSSYIVSSTISEEQMRSLVKEIKGNSSEYERRYITSTMLALDSHIDYSKLTFIFGAGSEAFRTGSVLGEYKNSNRTITIKRGSSQNTVAHEIGHAIDCQWYRDVWQEKVDGFLTITPINLSMLPEETAQWVKNFKLFIDNITDTGDTYSAYTMGAEETFARFVARFVEWTKTVATGRNYSTERHYYNDNFTTSQYLEFIKILQEKAKLDSARETSKTNNLNFDTFIRNSDEKSTADVKKSIRQAVDSEGNALSEQQAEFFKDSKVRDKDGNLLVVYHGTEADFTVFEGDYRGTIWFTDSIGVANSYSAKSKTKKVYLSMSNPLYVDASISKGLDIDAVMRQVKTQNKDGAIISFKIEDGWGYLNWIAENYPNSNAKEVFSSSTQSPAAVVASEQETIAEFLPKVKDVVYRHYFVFDSNQAKLTTNTNPTKNADIRYSLKPFAEQVDDVLNGKDLVNTHLQILDTTPTLLQEAGLPNLPMLMTAKHLRTITRATGKEKANYHNLSIDTVKELPKLLANPIMIMDSLTRNDSVVLLTETIDNHNNPIIAAIKIDGQGMKDYYKIEANIVTSVYGKDNFQSFIDRNASANSIVFWDKKKSQDLFNAQRLQLPDRIRNLNSNTIIRKSRAFVNRQTQKNAKNDETVNSDSESNTSSTNPTTSEDIRYSLTETMGEAAYSYDTLVKKPDINVINLTSEVPMLGNLVDRKGILFKAREIARTFDNKRNTETETYVNNPDTGIDVLITAKGIGHGLNRRSEVNEKVTIQISNILANSIAINELNKRGDIYDMSYVFLGVCRDNKGELYAVRTKVGKIINEITEFEIFQLSTIRSGAIKKSPNSALVGTAVTEKNSLISDSDSTISIRDLLEKVKSIPLINEVLSRNVAKTLGIERSVGTLSDSVRYALTPGEATTAEERALLEMPTNNFSSKRVAVRETLTDKKISFLNAWVNAQAGIERYCKKLGIADIESKTHFARSASSAANYMIAKELRPVFEQVRKGKKSDKAYASNFFGYLLHWHNTDRMATGVEKPVFGADVSVADSQSEITRYEAVHPEFRQLAEKVWAYSDKLLKMQLDGGLITQELYDTLRGTYPHYVPTYRDMNGGQSIGAVKGKSFIEINRSIKTAKGSDLDILPIDVMLARRTMQVIRAIRVNAVGKALLDAARADKNEARVQVVESTKISNSIDFDKVRPKNNQITLFEDGNAVTIAVSSDIFAGFDAFNGALNSERDNPVINFTKKWNTAFKKIVTAYNPFFTLRNAVRDLQDAGLYTKHGWGKFVKNLAVAYKEIATNGKWWNEYQEAGGLQSSVFDYDKGYTRSPSGLKKVISTIETVNIVVEQAPRLSEFISSRQNGASVEQALYDAADVTVNFGRSGRFARKLNSSFIPFLNPSIQGFDKLMRTVFGKKTSKEWMRLIVRSLLLGISVSLLNDLLLGDDDDYKNLRQSDKENNYLLKIGEGKFLKIPKGRVSAVMSQVFYVGKQVSSGEKVQWKDELSNASSNMSPVESLSRFVWSPFMDVKQNTTWYGSPIESAKFEGMSPRERYDENTSSIAIAIGKVINYSPKKIHYLLDQYSGVFGDFLLPLTTTAAEKGILDKNFTLDSTTQSNTGNEFYDLIEEVTYEKNEGDMKSKAVLKYLNQIKSKINELNAEKKVIQSGDLSNEEKTAQTRVLQVLINNMQKSAVSNAGILEDELSRYTITEDTYDAVFLTAYRNTFGAKATLEQYDDSVYARAQIMDSAGVDYETYFDVYFTLKSLTNDRDKNGNTIEGSRKKKVLAYIKTLKLTKAQKAMILAGAGYTLDSGLKSSVMTFAKTLDTEKRAELLEYCGIAA